MACWKAVITVSHNDQTWKVAFYKWGDDFMNEEAIKRLDALYIGCNVIPIAVETYRIDERTGKRI